MDNVFIERMWRSMKYACIDLNACETGSEAPAGLRKRIAHQIAERPHSTMGDLRPNDTPTGGPVSRRLAG
jgi:putative transposase